MYFDVMRFVQEIKVRKSLWDRNDVSYGDPGIKKQQQEEIAFIFTPNYCTADENRKQDAVNLFNEKWEKIQEFYFDYVLTRSRPDLDQRKLPSYLNKLYFLDYVDSPTVVSPPLTPEVESSLESPTKRAKLSVEPDNESELEKLLHKYRIDPDFIMYVRLYDKYVNVWNWDTAFYLKLKAFLAKQCAMVQLVTEEDVENLKEKAEEEFLSLEPTASGSKSSEKEEAMEVTEVKEELETDSNTQSSTGSA